MKNRFKIWALFFLLPFMGNAEEISPYKFTDREGPFVEYTIPASSRFSCPRSVGEPEIVYYFSRPPQEEAFPIAIFCTGSSSAGNVSSVIHVHRYFLQELWDLGLGVLTVEQWGVDGKEVNEEEFFAHYTRSQRREDHWTVIQHLQTNPPEGWNGKLVLIGVSEGGPLVTELAILYPHTIATINWCGAGDWPWLEELWCFLQDLKQKSWLVWAYDLYPRWMPFSWEVPHTRAECEALAQEMIQNPTPAKWMGGMTYLYHADALQTPSVEYRKIRSPFLVVAGTEDSILASTDQFVQKAKEAGAPITYFRVEGMDHYVRHRPDVIQASFDWLQQQLDHQSEKPRDF